MGQGRDSTDSVRDGEWMHKVVSEWEKSKKEGKKNEREQKESRKGRYNSDTLGGWLLLSALIRGSSKYKWLNPPYTKWPFKILRASEFAS